MRSTRSFVTYATVSTSTLLQCSSSGPPHLRGPDRAKRQRGPCVAASQSKEKVGANPAIRQERKDDEHVAVSRSSEEQQSAGKESEVEQEVLAVEQARIPWWKERRDVQAARKREKRGESVEKEKKECAEETKEEKKRGTTRGVRKKMECGREREGGR